MYTAGNFFGEYSSNSTLTYCTWVRPHSEWQMKLFFRISNQPDPKWAIYSKSYHSVTSEEDDYPHPQAFF